MCPFLQLISKKLNGYKILKYFALYFHSIAYRPPYKSNINWERASHSDENEFIDVYEGIQLMFFVREKHQFIGNKYESSQHGYVLSKWSFITRHVSEWYAKVFKPVRLSHFLLSFKELSRNPANYLRNQKSGPGVFGQDFSQTLQTYNLWTKYNRVLCRHNQLSASVANFLNLAYQNDLNFDYRGLWLASVP